MKRVVFFVFSASGNTKKVCDLFAGQLAEQGCVADVVRIRKDMSMPDVASYDTVVLAYPVHGFNAPQIVLDFAKNLQEGQNKGYYVIKTSGEPLRINDASSQKLRRIMRRRGFVFKGEFHYVMPYNMIFRHSDKMAALMWKAALNAAPADARTIATDGEKPYSPSLRAKATRFAVAVEKRGIALIGMTYSVDKEKCITCGKCEKLCPVGNIKIENGRVKFGTHCLGCTACSFNCPENAINLGLLNRWKVNGAYDFGASCEDATEKDVCRYCHKSYVRYFREHGIEL